jgi:hypothetical protein
MRIAVAATMFMVAASETEEDHAVSSRSQKEQNLDDKPPLDRGASPKISTAPNVVQWISITSLGAVVLVGALLCISVALRSRRERASQKAKSARQDHPSKLALAGIVKASSQKGSQVAMDVESGLPATTNRSPLAAIEVEVYAGLAVYVADKKHCSVDIESSASTASPPSMSATVSAGSSTSPASMCASTAFEQDPTVRQLFQNSVDNV